MAKEIVATTAAPAAIGPYSQAVKVHGLLFTAGQIPLDPVTGKLVEGDIRAQTEQVMKNLQAVLEAGGASLSSAVKTTCFLANLDDFQVFNEIYGRYFSRQPPSRSTVQAARLPAGAQVEVECVALCE